MSSYDDYCWLIDEAEPWLRKVADDVKSQPATLAQVRALRSSIGAARAALVLEQVELRAKAREKFSKADELFFTRVGLERATDEVLAAYKAQRFIGVGFLADLCCGIGGDAMALAGNDFLTLVDRDSISLLLATTNVQRTSGQLACGFAEDVTANHIADVAAWHIDPDRRAQGARTSQVKFGEPGVEVIDMLRSVCQHAAVKVAPAADIPKHWHTECEREWIETRGECRQQVAWFGCLAESEGARTATIVDEHGEACSFVSESFSPPVTCTKLGRFVFDPSPSLVAAKLVGSLAEACELSALSSHSLYLTGDEAIFHPHLQSFAVDAELPLDVRQLKAWFRQRGVGRLEIKKRGIDVTPELLRPQLDLKGGNEATLVLARVGESVRAIICRRTA